MQELRLEQRVWKVVASIPYDRVASYGKIARIAGYPYHARFVGATLKRLSKDSLISWHRVINSQVKISFAVNAEAYITQFELLEREQIILKIIK